MEILVLDSNFKAIGVVDNFNSLIWTDRYKSYGDFEIFLSMDAEILNYLMVDYYLWIKESEHCMIIESIEIDSDTEDGSHLKVTGRSLESILERRIVWGQKVLTGNLQEAIRTILNEAFISPSIGDRRVDNFIFKASTDAKIVGLTINAQFTGDDLYSVIAGLCEANDIGFKVVLNDSNQFVFGLYVGVDRSYSQMVNPQVVFSPSFDNIINSNYYTSKINLKNVTFVAGEGEGSARKSAVVGSGSGLSRRELFTDASDISSNTESKVLSSAEYKVQLENRGRENLAVFIARSAFEGEVEAIQLFKYGEDFFIGDIVQVANEYGHEGRSYISELVISHSTEGVSIYPTFQMIQEKGV